MPKLVEMAAEFSDVKFVKCVSLRRGTGGGGLRGRAGRRCNCNKEFKDIGKALGIRVAPTFHLYRRGAQLAVMTGAKVEELRALVLAHR